MRRSWAAATVGVLALVVGLLSYFLIKATNERSSSSKGYVVWARFRDAAALFQKSRVQTAGIPVGQIEKRELDPELPVARVTVRLNPGIKLWENAVVSKKAASLLGEYYLEIDPGSPEGIVNGQRRPMRELKNGDQILNVHEPTSVGDLMANVGDLMPILHDILTDVKHLTEGPISQAAENANKLITDNSAILQSILTRVDRIAADVEDVTQTERGDVQASIKNVRDITESIKDLVGTSRGEVADTGEAVRSSLDKLKATVDNLDKSLKNMETITGRMEKGEGTVGHILTDDTIARNIENITDDAGGFIRSITKLQTIVGLRTEYNFLSGQPKEYLAVQLMPRPDKFYLIEIVNDPRGLRESQTVYTESMGKMGVTQTTTYSQNKLKFTLQFGKTYGGIITGRFGMKESTGGVGLDLHLVNDRLLLSVDLFDTLFNTYPRLQGRASVAVVGHTLYIVGGVDDILNRRAKLSTSGGFDFFLGGQLVFNDEDLKSLLLFGGGAAAGGSK